MENRSQNQMEEMQHELQNAYSWEDQVIDIINRELDKVENGEEYALRFAKCLKKVSDVAASAKKQVEESILTEAEKHPEKTFTEFGATFTKVAGRKTYSFKHIPSWNTEKEKLSNIEKLSKMAYDAHLKGKQVFDDETGEVIQPAEVSYSKDSVSIKINP